MTMIDKDFINNKRSKIDIYEYHKLINEYEKGHNFGLAFKMCMNCLKTNFSEDLRTIRCDNLTCKDDIIICVCKKCLPYNHPEDSDWKNNLYGNYNLLTIDKINNSYITYYEQHLYYHYLELNFRVSNDIITRKICCNKCFSEFIQNYSYERFDDDSENNNEGS